MRVFIIFLSYPGGAYRRLTLLNPYNYYVILPPACALPFICPTKRLIGTVFLAVPPCAIFSIGPDFTGVVEVFTPLKFSYSGSHTLSIFSKDCPRCGEAVSVQATHCHCGFSFEPTRLEEAAQALELTSQEEQLYENYLAARASQAEEALKVAETNLLEDPENEKKQALVEEARAEWEKARAELAAQTEKVERGKQASAAARRAVEKIRRTRSERRKAREQQAAAEARAKAAAEARKAAQAAQAKQVAMAKALAAQADAHIEAARASRPAAAPEPAARSTASDTVRAPARPVPKQKPTAPSPPAPANRDKEIIVSAPKPAAKAAPRISKKATAAFRAAQAARAERALKAAAAASKTPAVPAPANGVNGKKRGKNGVKPAPAPLTPGNRKAPSAAIHAKTPNKSAAKVRKRRVDANTCPNCTAQLKPKAKKCACGYVLQTSPVDMPELTLSEEDRLAMARIDSGHITKLG